MSNNGPEYVADNGPEYVSAKVGENMLYAQMTAQSMSNIHYMIIHDQYPCQIVRQHDFQLGYLRTYQRMRKIMARYMSGQNIGQISCQNTRQTVQSNMKGLRQLDEPSWATSLF